MLTRLPSFAYSLLGVALVVVIVAAADQDPAESIEPPSESQVMAGDVGPVVDPGPAAVTASRARPAAGESATPAQEPNRNAVIGGLLAAWFMSAKSE